MAQTKYSINLSAADYVFSPVYKGASVIIPGNDQNYYQATSGWAGDTPQRGVNITQVYYGENFLPTALGYRSVQYRYGLLAPEEPLNIAYTYEVNDGGGKTALLAITQTREFWLLSAYTSNAWLKLDLPVGFDWNLAGDVTWGACKGHIAVCVKGVGILELSLISNTLTIPPLIGIDPTLVGGITGAANYFIVWDDTVVYWSSTVNEWDFTPDLITGAGSGTPEGIAGRIVLAKEIADGFIVYTTAGIISAAYNANLASPWTFSKVGKLGGIRTIRDVSNDPQNTTHIVWASTGLALVELNQGTPLFPTLTDFIASGVVVGQFPELTYKNTPSVVAPYLIAGRYLCVSVGELTAPVEGEYPLYSAGQSYVYDMLLKRWGKLNVGHCALVTLPFTVAFVPPDITTLVSKSSPDQIPNIEIVIPVGAICTRISGSINPTPPEDLPT